MEINDILKLIQAVSEYSLTSLEIKEGDTKVTLKREKEISQIVTVSRSAVEPAVEIALPQSAPAIVEEKAPATSIDSDKVVTSPLVGTFYDSASPEADVFVKVGDTVKKGQVLGIIEAMKLMNEIESEHDGVIEAVLVGNEEVVEYGQPLFRIR